VDRLTSIDGLTIMKPRIGVLGSGTAKTELPAHFRERDDAIALALPIRLSHFARSAYERLLVDVGYVDAAQRGAADCDAIFINSFADYGIDAMRAVLAIPVIGAGEASLRLAAESGRRFAILTVWPQSMRFLYDERLRALQLADRCVAIEHFSPESELTKLGREDGVMERMYRHENSLLAGLRSVCQRLQREHGAEAIVLGCTCMAPIGPALAAASSIPVLESSRVGYDASIALARASVHEPPTAHTDARRQIIALVDSWAGAARGATVTGEPDCPVCETINHSEQGAGHEPTNRSP
jgi:allantoin racemase